MCYMLTYSIKITIKNVPSQIIWLIDSALNTPLYTISFVKKNSYCFFFVFLTCSFHEPVILQVMLQDNRQYIVCINLGSNVCMINMPKLLTKSRARLKNSTYIICFPYAKCYTMALWNRGASQRLDRIEQPRVFLRLLGKLCQILENTKL